MNGHLTLDIVTPERKVLSAEVTELQFPTEHRGSYGILPGHTPVMVPVGDGLATFVQDGQKRVATVFGGFAEVGPDLVTLLARESETPDMLEATEVEAAAKEAQARLKEARTPEELQQAQRDLAKAQIRLQALGQ